MSGKWILCQVCRCFLRILECFECRTKFNSSLGMEFNGELYGFSAVKVKLVASLFWRPFILGWIRRRTPMTRRFDTCASFYVEHFVLYISVLLLKLCVTIVTNLTKVLLINYTWIGSAYNKFSENIYFYILTLTIMAVVFDLLRAIAEYWFRIKNGISWGTFWFRKRKSERGQNRWIMKQPIIAS